MNSLIIITNRTAKILGALLKGVSYIFHFIFPNKRFTIPVYSAPIIKVENNHKIPKKIWQTNYTNKVSLPVYINYLFNRLMSLDYEYNYVSTEDRLEYMRDNASEEVFKAFDKLTDGASQADLWRLFVLNDIGGIYMDIDAHAVWPLSKMIDKDDTEVFLLNKEHYTNYFIASKKENQILTDCIDLIVDNIQNSRVDRGVYELTGPGVLNIAIGEKDVKHRYYKYTCVQGSFTNEYFQYIDKPRGKWTHAKTEDLLQD
jgi:mannosyltransferase OCH1-like enzyme